MDQSNPGKPLEPLSARAVGLFLYMLGQGSYMTSDELSEVFKEGRDAIRTALEELRAHGLLITEKQKIEGGRFVTVSKLVMPKNRRLENRSLKSRPLIQLNLYKLISNIKNNFITNSSSGKELYNLKNTSAFADKEKYTTFNIPTGGHMSDDDDYYADMAREKELWNQEQQVEFESKKLKAHNKVMASGKNIHGCVAEFVNRVNAMWGVKQWTQDTKNFRIAYSNARRTHETTGDIEFKMMDLFFGSKEYIGQINDPNHIWRKFISMFGPLSIQVKNTMLSGDVAEKEEIRVAKSMEKLFDV